MELTRRIPFLLLALSLLSCDPFHASFEPVEPAALYEAAQIEEPEAVPQTLSVMTWNVKFGGGRVDFFFDCFGDRALMNRREVNDHLDGIVSLIREVDPDIILLQEVDVGSKRTVFIDQLQRILDETSLNYGAYASQWRVDFIPSDGLGAMDNGNAILSKWPLTQAERVALPRRADQSGLERYFYLRRNFLRAEMRLPDGRSLWFANVHADAYGEAGTKEEHIALFYEELERLSIAGDLTIAGGDFNAIPPDSMQQHDFPDSVCEDEEFIADDYRMENEWLRPFYQNFSAAVPLADYAADNALHFTHTVDSGGFWNRKLDYLFTNGQWTPESSLTLQSASRGGFDTMPLSDHAPLIAELQLP
jgi:endonuclease/exonuclease/phosphatase family metal-dependent hydrolase